MRESIEKLLLNNRDLWRACDLDKVNSNSTGDKKLDNILPGGGWPKKGLVEVINQYHGIGELQLLIPLMLSVIKQGKWILWVCPPHIVYAPALQQAGIDTDQILVVNKAVPCKDALWSMERALRSNNCGLVLTWQTWLSVKVLRRLQLAAETGSTLGFIFKSRDNKYSPSRMRIRIKNITNFEEASITVIKAHDGSRAQSTNIKLYKHHLHTS
ncbi:MAG: hypothetical protein CMQ30_08535 [Gammaproteobacteria bacterium]|nr:hypothetical protein [Gammaproteobacteria bacterium]